jgi:hypothetical protein
MASSKPTVGPHQFANEGRINLRAPMPFVCPCSYLVLIPAYLYRPLYHLLHRARIERCMLVRLPSVIALFQQTEAEAEAEAEAAVCCGGGGGVDGSGLRRRRTFIIAGGMKV